MLNRTIFFSNEHIDENNTTEAIEKILTLDDESNEDITLYINSYGGSTADGFALYDAIQLVKSDVRTVAMGSALSMGAILAMCGTPGKRFSWPSVMFLVHEVRSNSEGTCTALKTHSKMVEIKNKLYVDTVLKHTNLDKKRLEELMLTEEYLTAPQAKELGFIDEVL